MTKSLDKKKHQMKFSKKQYPSMANKGLNRKGETILNVESPSNWAHLCNTLSPHG